MHSVEISPKLERYFRLYRDGHQNPVNQVCHYVGLPVITITSLGLLARIVIGPSGFAVASELLRLDAGTLLWVVGSLWYLFLDWRMALPFSLFSLGLYFLGRALPLPACWALWVGLILSIIGNRAPPAVLIHGLPLVLLAGVPCVAHFLLRWKGFLRGYLVGLGLVALGFGYCALRARAL